MVYTKQTWANGAVGATPLSAARLNHIEDGIEAAALVTATVKTANYTAALVDQGSCIEVNSTSALTVTIPTNANVAFPVGTILEVARINTGSVTIVAAGGVTLRTPSGLTARAQYSTISLRQRATNEWIIGGDLT